MALLIGASQIKSGTGAAGSYHRQMGGKEGEQAARKAKRHRVRGIAEAEDIYQESLSDEENFEPLEPFGIAGWQYADRLRQKVFRQLETVLNMGVNVAGHSQLVQAARTLLAEADKSKDEAGYYETLLEADKFLISLGYLSGKPTLQK